MKTRFIAGILFIALGGQPVVGQENNHIDELRDFQLSILPMVGTHGADAVNHRYRVSINLFAGLTGGIEGFEAGGFLNITSGHVDGFQISGFGNLVMGHVSGFQAAGFFNANNGDAQAFRGAGLLNYTTGSFEGFAGAGFANITGGSYQGFAGAGFANISGGDLQGFAGAGFANITGGSFQGFSGAGFANVIGGSAEGFMAAGFANVVGNDSQGFHGAGFANITGGNATGPQIAGFLNVANNLQGAQISGFLNVTKQLDGMQLGFINIADTIASGLPIGFLSIVKKGGLMQIEVAGSDVMHLSASFRSGVRGFYNIFSYSARPFSDERMHGFGYGIGTGVAVGSNTMIQVEAHSTQLHESFRWNHDELDLLNEGRLILSRRTGGSTEVFAAAVLYNQLSSNCSNCGFVARDIAPARSFHERQWNDYLSRWWFGFRAGLRLNLR